jgi:hypothetical protein
MPSPVSALALGAVLAGALAAGPLPAAASQINTGGEAGANLAALATPGRPLKAAQELMTR